MRKHHARERLLLPVLLIILAVLTALMTMLSPDNPTVKETLANRSIYNGAPSGYKAWFLASKKAGLPILPFEKGFDELSLLPQPATMVIVKPYTVTGTQIVFGPQQANELLEWVKKGNTLVLLDDFNRSGSQAIATRLSLKAKRTPLGKGITTTPETPAQHVLVARDRQLKSFVFRPLLSNTAWRLNPMLPSPFPVEPILLNKQGQPVLLKVSYFLGTLIVGTAADLAQNHYLHSPSNDNMQLLSNILAQEKKPIYVNEYVHGHAQAENLLTYYQQKTPLGAIFFQLMLAFLMMLWLSFTRWAPESSVKEDAPTSPLGAYIQSLAGIYYRTQAASLALRPALQRLETELRKRYRVSLDEEARLRHLLESLLADYSNKRDTTPDGLLKALKQAQAIVRENAKASPQDVLHIARQLALIEERLRHERRIHAHTR